MRFMANDDLQLTFEGDTWSFRQQLTHTGARAKYVNEENVEVDRMVQGRWMFGYLVFSLTNNGEITAIMSIMRAFAETNMRVVICDEALAQTVADKMKEQLSACPWLFIKVGQ